MNLLHNGEKDKDITLKSYLQFFQRFQKLESASGILLLLATACALLLANSGLRDAFHNFWQGSFSGVSPLFLINEGMMTLFFLLVGLELKREWVEGELAKPAQVLLPAVAAVGGMLAPALIYTLLNQHQPSTIKGWAIPVATDIAFALGALSLVGRRVPSSLKMFLMALAIFDDVGAILIIALCYSQKLEALYLICSAGLVLGLALLSYFRISLSAPYLLLGFILWYLVLHSGIHPTIAGVIVALFMPIKTGNKAGISLEEALHPWVAYLIMPLFALANAGLTFGGLSHAFKAADRIAEGIVLGLFLGKPLGVFSSAWLLIRLGVSNMPVGANWLQLAGVSLLCGIGFTMSLFLGTLAFTHQELYMTGVRLGVLLGSLLSGLLGCVILLLAIRWKNNEQHNNR